MWVLMYAFSYSVSPAATSDRAEWRLQPTVVFQESSNEERCKEAKVTLETSLKPLNGLWTNSRTNQAATPPQAPDKTEVTMLPMLLMLRVECNIGQRTPTR